MPVSVKYTGVEDFRELSARDFDGLDVAEFRKTTFPRFQPVVVEEDVAEALLNDDRFEGRFEVEEEVEEQPKVVKDLDAPQKSSKKTAMTTSGAEGQTRTSPSTTPTTESSTSGKPVSSTPSRNTTTS